MLLRAQLNKLNMPTLNGDITKLKPASTSEVVMQTNADHILKKFVH